ncbi:PilN domain-containing protein [candidate division WOR-3 bacterium]|nr:PilN domain-containing protein [candidate division WOR-3 bacterium]
MIEINLLPEEKRKRKKELSMPSLSFNVPGNMMFYAGIGVFVVLIILMIIIHFSQVGSIKRLNGKIDEKRTELKKLQEEKKKVENMKAKQITINNKIETIKKLAVNRFTYPKFLDELSRNMPDYLWLEDMTISGSSMIISGKTFSNLIITDFLTNLKKMSEFIDGNSISLKELVNTRVDAHDIISFQISCKFLK